MENTLNKKNISLWIAQGPALLLCAFFLLFFRPITSELGGVYLLAAGGVIACVKWRERGLMWSTCALAIATIFSLGGEEWQWMLGLSCIFFLIFIITTLTYEEVSDWIHDITNETQQIQNQLDFTLEKLLSQERNLAKEREVFSAKILELDMNVSIEKDQNARIRKQISENEFLNLQLSQELEAHQKKISRLVDHLEKNEKENVHWKSEIEKARQEISDVIQTKEAQENQHQNMLEIMRQKFETLNREKLLLETTSANLLRELEQTQKQIQEKNDLLSESDLLMSSAKSAIKEEQEHKLRMIEEGVANELRWKEQLQNLEKLYNETSSQAALVKEEKNKLTETLLATQEERDSLLKKLEQAIPIVENKPAVYSEAMYRQLKSQFEQKTIILDETRRELFHTKEQLTALKRELDENRNMALDPYQNALIRHCMKLESEWKKSEKEAQEEINLLYEIANRAFR